MTRKAVIQLFAGEDLLGDHLDVPCTCSLQYLVRHGRFNAITYMRSNDIVLGLPHDAFCFTMLQEIIARSLGIEVGTYIHMVGSLHLYTDKRPLVEAYIAEGWQATTTSMPPMPNGDPWPAIGTLLQAEESLRRDGVLSDSAIDSLDPYWQDLVRLLQIYRARKARDRAQVETLQEKMSSGVYDTFIAQQLDQIT